MLYSSNHVMDTSDSVPEVYCTVERAGVLSKTVSKCMHGHTSEFEF